MVQPTILTRRTYLSSTASASYQDSQALAGSEDVASHESAPFTISDEEIADLQWRSEFAELPDKDRNLLPIANGLQRKAEAKAFISRFTYENNGYIGPIDEIYCDETTSKIGKSMVFRQWRVYAASFSKLNVDQLLPFVDDFLKV